MNTTIAATEVSRNVGAKLMSVVFDRDDEAYQAWLAGNPKGFVLNTGRDRSPSYMVLHRASCSKIRAYNRMAQPGGFTERDFIKVCAATIDDLRAWVRRNGRRDGTFSTECGLCKPDPGFYRAETTSEPENSLISKLQRFFRFFQKS